MTILIPLLMNLRTDAGAVISIIENLYWDDTRCTSTDDFNQSAGRLRRCVNGKDLALRRQRRQQWPTAAMITIPARN